MVKKQIIELLNLLGFRQDGNIYTKKYKTALHPLQVDVEKELIYYDNSGITLIVLTLPILAKMKTLWY